jgi:hypothetical protein
MHIHANLPDMNPVNPYAAAAEKAIAKQRAAIGRKKLAKRALGIEGAPSPVEAFMIGTWMASRPDECEK